MSARGKKDLEEAISKAPPKVKKLLRESQLILGGLLEVSGEIGDVVVRKGNEVKNATWVKGKVRIKPVKKGEVAGVTKAFSELGGKHVKKIAVVVSPEKPEKIPKKAAA